MGKSFKYTIGYSFNWNYVQFSSFAIVAGGLIYVLFRPVEPVFFDWFRAVGMENWLITIREKTLSIYSFLPQWIVFSMPNGLWAFAYTLFILFIWTGSTSLLKYFWFSSIPVLVFGFEVLQLTNSFQGTFCMNDIIWSAIGITIGIFTSYIITRQISFKLILVKYLPAISFNR
jgi:hypothetical protein